MTLPSRLVLRRLGQDPGPDSGSTDPGSVVTDPNLTGGSTGSSSDWVSTVGGWISDIAKGVTTGAQSNNSNSGGGTPATAAPQTAPQTNNAAVPGVPAASSGVSTTTLALIGGSVAVTGLVVYLAAKGGSRSGRRR